LTPLLTLTVLGGSAAGPNPGQGCSGYLVTSRQTNVVLDLGPGTLIELRKHADFRQLDAVVLSHLHLDHMLDVLALRFALAYNPIPSPRPVPLWLPPGGIAFMTRLARAFSKDTPAADFLSVFALCEYDPNEPLSIDELQIQFHQTSHFVPCWAMRVGDGVDAPLCYTADTGPATSLAHFATGATIIVAEGTDPDDSKPGNERGHLSPREAGRLATVAGADVLILSHLWAENDPFVAIRDASADFPGQVILATPGLRVNWGGQSGDR
jgi:ribonuclease BN (tRNA processing enzyme)